MKIAIISPVELLNRFSIHTNTQMALADLALRYPEYGTWFRKRKCKSDFIILDNSFHELRYALSGEQIYKAYMKIGTADLVVCPDKWPDPIETEILTADFLNSIWAKKMWDANGTVNFMFVAHGKVLADFVRAVAFCKDVGINYIGISTDNSQLGGLSRVDITRTISNTGWKGSIHWLGIGNPVGKTLKDAINCGVDSIDGSSPLKMALRGIDLETVEPVKPSLDLESKASTYSPSQLIKAEKVIRDLTLKYAETRTSLK